jgi:glutaminyl-tRNA synthetase
VTDLALLEHCVREDLNLRAPRVMGVLRPLKVVIDNYPDSQVEEVESENNPEDPSLGSRKLPFSKVVYIEQDDFREDPPKGFFRLSPGREVRLKDAYYITCVDVIKDAATGEVVELHCTYDPESKGGQTSDRRKVRGTSHWVSAAHAVEAEVRLYDTLFSKADPNDESDTEEFTDFLNPGSLEVLTGCLVEPGLSQAAPGSTVQFLRQGYFCVDSEDSTTERLVFNRTVPLRDSWAKALRMQG